MRRDDSAAERGEGRQIPLVLDLAITAALTVVLVIVVKSFVLDTYMIPTGSMLETIKLDDLLFGEKVSYYFRSPKVGEIVTFDDPEDPSVTLIKRVIATEGQTVDLVDGALYIDGELVDEPYVGGKPTYEIDRHASSLAGPVTYPYTVPEGRVWVMGDNRTNSLDSRYFGAVEVTSVHSHAVLIYWPLSDIKTL